MLFSSKERALAGKVWIVSIMDVRCFMLVTVFLFDHRGIILMIGCCQVQPHFAFIFHVFGH